MAIRPKAIAIRTMPRQLKFGSLLRLLSREEFRSGCAIEFSARGSCRATKIYMSRVSIAMSGSRSHAFGLVRQIIERGVRLGWAEDRLSSLCAQRAFRRYWGAAWDPLFLNQRN